MRFGGTKQKGTAICIYIYIVPYICIYIYVYIQQTWQDCRGRFETGGDPGGKSMGDFLNRFRKSPSWDHLRVMFLLVLFKHV